MRALISVLGQLFLLAQCLPAMADSVHRPRLHGIDRIGLNVCVHASSELAVPILEEKVQVQVERIVAEAGRTLLAEAGKTVVSEREWNVDPGLEYAGVFVDVYVYAAACDSTGDDDKLVVVVTTRLLEEVKTVRTRSQGQCPLTVDLSAFTFSQLDVVGSTASESEETIRKTCLSQLKKLIGEMRRDDSKRREDE